jgi:hypothetical protein
MNLTMTEQSEATTDPPIQRYIRQRKSPRSGAHLPCWGRFVEMNLCQFLSRPIPEQIVERSGSITIRPEAGTHHNQYPGVRFHLNVVALLLAYGVLLRKVSIV